MPRPPYIRVGAEGAISPRGSIFASSTLREQQSDKRSKVSLPANASSSTQAPTGQPCSTGVGNNPLTIPEHSQRAVSRMPKARRSRLSLTRCAGCATLPNHKPRRQRFVVHPNSARSTLFAGVGNNPLTITKPSQRAMSRMPKARRSRLSLTRCAGWATLPRTSTTFHLLPLPAQIFPPALYYIADLLYSILTRKTNDKPIYAG